LPKGNFILFFLHRYYVKLAITSCFIFHLWYCRLSCGLNYM